jgi:N-acetylmuramoyl-L-alanine amidase
MIPQRDNIINNGYIGELNEKPGTINILAELGFFSNPNEAQILSSDDYVNYMAKHMGDEIIKILESVK